MFTALKDDVLQYVIWNGVSKNYPRWFTDQVPMAYDDNHEYVMYEDGFKSLDPGDVFILNSRNQHKYLSRELFDKHLDIINYRYCALKEDTFLWHMDVDTHEEIDGEEEYIVITNSKGQERSISLYDFDNLFANK